MPSVPKPNVCGHLGCHAPRYRHFGYCEEHGGTNIRLSPKRIEQMDMYNNGTWERHRRIQLGKQPLCQACLLNNKVRGATTVDHVFPWSGMGNEYFYRNLFQSLCGECHSVKTRLEQKDVIHHYTPHGVVTYTMNDAINIISRYA